MPLPGWLNRIKISGDVRVRGEEEIYDDDNAITPYIDYAEFNDNGPFTSADFGNAPVGEQGFINTTENRTRQRVRLRLNLDAQVNEEFSVGVRISTGNTRNPVSLNQTLGDSSSPKDVVIDRAFIEYNAPGERDWLTVTAGRFANPWYSTELVWDNDLNFEGLAGTLRWPLNFGGDAGLYSQSLGNKEIFITMGAFPLEEFERSSNLDRWLFGGQIGGSWVFSNQSKVTLAAAYYDFSKVQAPIAPRDRDEFLASAPGSLQQGNSVFPVIDPVTAADTDIDNDLFLFGLASDYDLLNITGSVDIANFAPHHLIITADYVKNIGYDSGQVNDRLLNDVDEQTEGYSLTVNYGWLDVTQFGHWNAYFTYKRVERDAVLDAFTDSNFHLGGTDAEGWEVGGNFGISHNAWLTLTWSTADEIDGPAFATCGVAGFDPACDFSADLLQLDLHTKF